MSLINIGTGPTGSDGDTNREAWAVINGLFSSDGLTFGGGTLAGSFTSVGFASGGTIASGSGIALPATNELVLFANSAPVLEINDGAVRISSGVPLSWGAVSGSTIGRDAGISRTGAGALAVGNGTQGDTSGSLALASITIGGIAGGYLGVPQNSQSTDYTAVLADSAKCIFHPASDNNARTFTIPANASVAYPVGTVIAFTNMAAASVTIAITSDTLTLLPDGTTGSRTLAQYGKAYAEKISSTAWTISGNSALS